MKLEILSVEHVPDVQPGMDLARVLEDAIAASGFGLHTSDVLAVTQKVVSKAEGRVVHLGSVEPSEASRSIARQLKADARLIDVILRESRRVVRMRGEILICETFHGLICANAGVDRSNVGDVETVTLLPEDPDRSARRLADRLGCGVMITDTFGRPWREGLLDTAIGIARISPFIDYRDRADVYGYRMQATLIAAADALAAAAGLAMGKTQRTPAALIRGFLWEECNMTARDLIRLPEKNLFL